MQPHRPATATLTYTSTGLEEGFKGAEVGVSALHFYSKPEFCVPVSSRRGDVRQVSKNQSQVTVTIPASQPLVVEGFWSAAGQHCLLGNRTFLPEPGVHYRLTSRVDVKAGQCNLWLEERKPAGKLVEIGQLPTLDQICRGRR
ncbi:MAG: hypothetical protein L0H29_03015 [Sinobacteraceae bacterium]|nr:hypothetical protein [Nevskiaceae bacterium]